MITIVRGLALAAVLSVPTATNAAIIHLTTPLGLTGSQEVPVRVTPGTGTGEAILDTVALTLEVDLTWQDLVAPAAAAHIHCCSGPGANSLVAIDFVPVGFPSSTSGSFSHTFSLLSAATYGAAFLVRIRRRNQEGDVHLLSLHR